MSKANQDIRDYMADHGVTQRDLAADVGVSQYKICKELQTELSQKDKEIYLNKIDAIAAQRLAEIEDGEDTEQMQESEESEECADASASTKFQIGDLVKIPAKQMTIGTVCDIWHSLLQDKTMYAVDIEGGGRGLYMEEQLEIAPLPIEYSFRATCENNVAVVCMIAKQGEKTWVYARGHAHILHDGAVGEAQAVSFAAKRMFESLDTKQENRIYFKEGNKNG
jgi:hypothetical protein